MRRFVALPVPDDVRRLLQTTVAPLHEAHGDDLRWTRPEGWHVTLAFLGEVEDHDVPSVVEVVRAALGDGPLPKVLRLAGPGRFGRDVLWSGVSDDPTGSVAALGASIQQGLDQAGLPVQLAPVRAHVTLARSRRRTVSDAVVASLRVPDAAWSADTVQVWRSHLGDGPARYEVDASVPLP